MSNKPIGPCATCGRPTTDQRTCPGYQKTLYLHVFCGVADHAKVIWCRPCAAKAQSLNKAGPSSGTIPAPSNKPTLFTAIARTPGPFTQAKKGTRKSQSLLPFATTKKKELFPNASTKAHPSPAPAALPPAPVETIRLQKSPPRKKKN